MVQYSTSEVQSHSLSLIFSVLLIISFMFCVFLPDAINFVDFEYAGLNYQAYDIANHFNEYAGELFIYYVSVAFLSSDF